ncbi:hypothetical protein [uncultured Mucilaginibacter sp.]|uniref:hypothetical protein n=1 Tax=uncultured Mucilaginibacter sp. TaxID=797541 RepID=UPI002600C44C|nr:hypothetical protein [uncultured Mucilaginibacter sp.]
MKKTLILFFALLLFFAFGCKKDATQFPSQTNLLLSLETVTNSAGQVTDSLAYNYDEFNRLTEFKHSSNGDDYIFNYDDYDNLTSVNYYNQRKLINVTIFNYNGSTVVQNTVYFVNGAVSGIGVCTLTLNANQKIIKRDYGANNYDSYTYDALGNLNTESFYKATNTTTPFSTASFLYDNSKSPFTNAKGNYNLFIIDNSKNRWDYKYYTNNVTGANFGTYTITTGNYLYTDAGFPASVTFVNSSTGASETHSYSYTSN